MIDPAMTLKSYEGDPDFSLPEIPAIMENPAETLESQDGDPESRPRLTLAIMVDLARTLESQRHPQYPAKKVTLGVTDHPAKTLVSLGDYPELPVDGPVGSPHIIDMATLDSDFIDYQMLTQKPTVADAVATILFNSMPGTLTTFLDLIRPAFTYIQVGSLTCKDFCIKRTRRTVTVKDFPRHIERG